jgi:hypothetical protein
MLLHDPHLSDEELLLLSDGELRPRRARRIQRHLACCWECRTRAAEFEHAIAEFVHAHRAGFDAQLPPAAGPRALLRARLAESGRTTTSKRGWGPFGWVVSARSLGAIAAAAVLSVAGSWTWVHRSGGIGAQSIARVLPAAVPNRSLTPGAVRTVGLQDVCAEADNDPLWKIPSALQQAALREYGVSGSRAKDYQLDFLIPPSLGGTDDIHNLWPEPDSKTVWNARAKDALEDRLHELVCAGQLDISTAQREISSDWISAYKRYIHTNRPTAFERRSVGPGSARARRQLTGKLRYPELVNTSGSPAELPGSHES